MVAKTLTFPKLMSIIGHVVQARDVLHQGERQAGAESGRGRRHDRVERGTIKDTDIRHETHDIQVPTIQIPMMVSR